MTSNTYLEIIAQRLQKCVNLISDPNQKLYSDELDNLAFFINKNKSQEKH